MKVVDLFCGAGGFSKGFADAGFEILAGFDFEPTALRIHEANLPKVHRWTLGPRGRRRLPERPLTQKLGRHVEADLTALLEWSATIAELAPDVVIGGPPCQSFSASGKRRGDADPRAKLTEAFAVIVTSARPRFFVMENVPASRNSEVYRRAMVLFKRAGYGITAMELNASRYGVGQRRRRWIVVGALDEADDWLEASLLAAASSEETTVADVLGDEIGAVFFRRGHSGGERRSLIRADEPGMTITTTVSRRGNAEAGYPLRDADVAVLETLPPEDLEKLYFLYPGGSSSAGSHSVNKPAPTLTRRAWDAPGEGYKPRKGDVIDVKELPILTLDQLSRIAGFPPGWVWQPEGAYISKAKRILALANAVAPPMANAIANCILAHTRNVVGPVTPAVPKKFGTWLRKEAGVKKASVSQRMSEVRAALRLLGSRDLPHIDVAERHLEGVAQFKSLSVGRRSNLRTALRLWYRYKDPEWDAYDPRQLALQDREEETGEIPASIRLGLRAPLLIEAAE